jgi:hypothetical protein
MRGIEIRRIHLRSVFVPPLQGGGEWLEDGILVLVLGLRAGRSTPSYHISGFQPSVWPGPKACHVIAWAEASTASAGPGNRSCSSPKPCKGETRMALSSAILDRAFKGEL